MNAKILYLEFADRNYGRNRSRMLFGVFLFALSIFIGLFSGHLHASSPVVHEVTIAAPDIIRVEVRETEVRRGHITKLNRPVVPDQNGWATLADGRTGVVVGPERDHFRIADTTIAVPLNRNLVDRVEGYQVSGGRRINGVYRKSVPFSSGTGTDGPIVSFSHFIYLHLDAKLEAGRYEISWPDEVLPATVFEYQDTHTRSSSIRASHLGHAPGDVSKYAYLAMWVPDGPDNGAVDFRIYGLDKFEVIDQDGQVVFSGDITLRTKPRDPETGNGFKEGLISYTKRDGSNFIANRAGTYVFGLDYSGWQNPLPGSYRLRIPGLGVSDSFKIADGVWTRAAQSAMAGLYHQRSGLELDGRFGYRRPECFTEDSGVTVYRSRLPIALSTEGNGFISFVEGAKKPWITRSVIKNAWGGYHDAGDWDRRVQHLEASYLLLDVFEQIPESARHMSFNLPESRVVLPHPLYQDRELPDIVEEAVWNIDFFRRLQGSDGGVSGGIESSRGPKKWEPCWLESNKVFAYAPDAGSSFAYAAAAAKLAIVLQSLGETKLAGLFSESAAKAWYWAELKRGGVRGGFAEALSLLGPATSETKQQMSVISKIEADYRLWAAATLFRLKGDREFQNVVEERFRSWVDMQGPRLHAGWEYLHAIRGGRSEATLVHTRNQTIRLAEEFILLPQSRWSYRSLKHASAPMVWGEGLAPSLTEIAALIRAHRLTGGRKDFLAAMQDSSAHVLGANQIGMSFTTGLGHRWPKAPLHEDSIAAGVQAPHGITIYGWVNPVMTNYDWLWGPSWAALSENVPKRRVEPFRNSLPIYEYIIEHPRLIMTSEYTVQQTIATTAVMWIYLAAQ